MVQVEDHEVHRVNVVNVVVVVDEAAGGTGVDDLVAREGRIGIGTLRLNKPRKTVARP